MHIDKYKQPDGTYLDEEGHYHENAECFLHLGILAFCICGDPEFNLKFVRDCLHHIDNLSNVHRSNFKHIRDPLLHTWREQGEKLMGRAEYFIQYTFDHLNLTEHGGNVTGAWLTEKGRELMEDIDELYPPEK